MDLNHIIYIHLYLYLNTIYYLLLRSLSLFGMFSLSPFLYTLPLIRPLCQIKKLFALNAVFKLIFHLDVGCFTPFQSCQTGPIAKRIVLWQQCCNLISLTDGHTDVWIGGKCSTGGGDSNSGGIIRSIFRTLRAGSFCERMNGGVYDIWP